MGVPMGTCGPYPLRSRGKQMTVAGVVCVVNGVNNPATVIDDGNILMKDPTFPSGYRVEYVANGYIRFTLRERWTHIQAFSLLLDAALESDVTACTQGTAADNTVTVHGHVATVNAGGFTAGDRELGVGFILVR